MPSYDNATRAQALTLKLVGFSNAEIEKITGIQPRTVSAIHRKAIARGLNPEESKKILDHHVEDAPRSGRPRSRPKRLLQRSFQRSVWKQAWEDLEQWRIQAYREGKAG